MIDEEVMETLKRCLTDDEFRRLCLTGTPKIISGAEDWDDSSIYPSRKKVFNLDGRFGAMTVKYPSKERALEIWEKFCSPDGRKYSITRQHELGPDPWENLTWEEVMHIMLQERKKTKRKILNGEMVPVQEPDWSVYG